jgi:hypothetical protein
MAAAAVWLRAPRLSLDARDGMRRKAIVRPDYVSNIVALTLLFTLVAAFLLLGNITLELVELPPALSGSQ